VKTTLLVLFGVALAAAGYGIWLVATEDVQGGRDAAGGILLTAAAIAGGLGWLAPRGGRRRA
jgi:hypothetical protein